MTIGRANIFEFSNHHSSCDWCTDTEECEGVRNPKIWKVHGQQTKLGKGMLHKCKSTEHGLKITR